MVVIARVTFSQTISALSFVVLGMVTATYFEFSASRPPSVPDGTAACVSSPVLSVVPTAGESNKQTAVTGAPQETLPQHVEAAPAGPPGRVAVRRDLFDWRAVNTSDVKRIARPGCERETTWCRNTSIPAIYPIYDPATGYRAVPHFQFPGKSAPFKQLVLPLHGIEWPSRAAATQQQQPSAENVSLLTGQSNLPWVQCATRNAVLGYAVHYSAAVLQHFIASFQRYATPCDDLVLWVTKIPSDLVYDHLPNNVLFQYFDDYIAAIPTSHRDMDIRAHRHLVVWVRICMLNHWVQKHWRSYRYIINMDTRDALFMSNPFSVLYMHKLQGLFSTEEVTTLHEAGVNHKWLKNCAEKDYSRFLFFAPHPLDPKGWFPVICNGLFGGSSDAIVDYFHAYSKIVLYTARLRHMCADQAVHIYMQLTGLPGAKFPHRLSLTSHATGPFRHMYLGTVVRRDQLGRHYNCLNEPYAIVHQLDREKPLWWDARRPYDMLGQPGVKMMDITDSELRGRCAEATAPAPAGGAGAGAAAPPVDARKDLGDADKDKDKDAEGPAANTTGPAAGR